MYDALKNTQVGDFLAVYSSSTRKTTKHEVTRTTATQVIIGKGASEVRYMRESGRQVGAERWDRSDAEPWTAEHDQRIVDAARLREQKVAFADMLAAFDRATADARQLRYRDRLFDPAQVEAVRVALEQAGAVVSAAVKGVE